MAAVRARRLGRHRSSAPTIIYYRFFGDVLSTPALLAVGQTRASSGSIRSLFTPGLVWLIVDLPFAAWLIGAASRHVGCSIASRSAARGGWPLAPRRPRSASAGFALSAPRVLASAPLDQMFRDRAVVEQLGPFGFHAYDAWTYARATVAPAAADRRADRRRSRPGSPNARRCAPAPDRRLRRGARQEPDRRAGGVAAGFRRRLSAWAARR